MPWTVLPNDSEILAVHVALLSNGKILIFPGDQHRGSATDFMHARLFNPITNLIEPCTAPDTDVFCSGHSFLGDGRIVVAGGTDRYGAGGHVHDAGGVSPFSGEHSTWTYEPRANRWVRVGDLNFRPGQTNGGGRWYPSLITLGTGEILIFSGHPHESDSRHNNDSIERYSPGGGGWSLLTTEAHTGPFAGSGFYPRIHLLPEGLVFIAMHIQGTNKRLFNPYADSYVGPDINDTGISNYDNFWDGPSVMLPLLPGENYQARVMMAGYQPKIIDFGASTVQWQNTVPRVTGMPNRTYACGVILPTAEVLIIGGASNVGADIGVLQAEIYAPGIDWTADVYSPSGGPGPQPNWSVTSDSATVTRNYHSVAILMPDGRVWTAGSSKGANPGNPNDANIAEKRMEIFDPPYIGQPRPNIVTAPDYINYAAVFEIETNAAVIERVALIRCGSVTHAFDADQRYVGLDFESIAGTNRLRVTTPPHGNVAPPGQYMLWVIDDAGRPCTQAPILRLAHTDSVVWTDRSSFSVHEVEALLSAPGGGPALFHNALYYAVEGHLPHEINALVGVPNLTLHFDSATGPAVPVAQINLASNGTPLWEDPDQPLDRPQRVTYAFDVRFPSAAVFAGLDNRQVWVNAVWGDHRTVARLELTDQPNPYMTDGPVPWLSTDLRIYKIRRGETKHGGTFEMGDTPLSYLQRQQGFFNTAVGEPFFRSISEEQTESKLTKFSTEGGQDVYNFAFAKVRYRAITATAPNVAVFFRMFNSVGTAIEFEPSGTYLRHEWTDGAIPLLGRQGGTLISIPFFGESRVTPGADMITQRDNGNVHDLEPNGANEFQWHYGAYLDINQETQAHFSATGGGNGPFGADAQSVKALLRDMHQCLVAEVYFKSTDPMAPSFIVSRATPGSSDKLSQRNIAFVNSANPGEAITRTVHHTFEIKPSPGSIVQAAMMVDVAMPQGGFFQRKGRSTPDELMFKWGNLPKTALVDVYLPAVEADDILTLLAMRSGPGMIQKVDKHTVRCRVGDVGYIPIPTGSVNHAGLLSIELPAGVTHGQMFVVSAHQISGQTRRIIGAFELRVVVRHQHLLLVSERRRLSLLRWIYEQIPAGDRWLPVFDRYLLAIADRYDAFGGDASAVLPSPHEDGSVENPKKPFILCWSLPIVTAVLVALCAMLPPRIAIPVLAGGIVLLVALLVWQKYRGLCYCEQLLGLLFGLIIGTAIAGVAALSGLASLTVVVVAAVLMALVAVAAVLRRCLRFCADPCSQKKEC